MHAGAAAVAAIGPAAAAAGAASTAAAAAAESSYPPALSSPALAPVLRLNGEPVSVRLLVHLDVLDEGLQLLRSVCRGERNHNQAVAVRCGGEGGVGMAVKCEARQAASAEFCCGSSAASGRACNKVLKVHGLASCMQSVPTWELS